MQPSENFLNHMDNPVRVKLSSAHGEEAIEECIRRCGSLEARQRPEIVIRVVAHAGERHVNQRAVVGLARYPEIEFERAIGGRAPQSAPPPSTVPRKRSPSKVPPVMGKIEPRCGV